jgi:carboxylesterase
MTTVQTEPFFLSAGPTGCLLLHGFTATPQEMRFLGARLHAQGFTVCGVRLAGHAAAVEDFARCTWHDWLASAREGLDELQRRTRRVVTIGQSLGALLALQLAADYPDAVHGAALLAPALVLANPWLRWTKPLHPAFAWLGRNSFLSKGERDVADPQARAESPAYPTIPVRALHQLLLLQKVVRTRLPEVRQPVLILHSRRDHTCPLANVALLERGLAGPVASVLLDESYHVLSVDVERERVATEVAGFVDRIADASARAAIR